MPCVLMYATMAATKLLYFFYHHLSVLDMFGERPKWKLAEFHSNFLSQRSAGQLKIGVVLNNALAASEEGKGIIGDIVLQTSNFIAH